MQFAFQGTYEGPMLCLFVINLKVNANYFTFLTVKYLNKRKWLRQNQNIVVWCQSYRFIKWSVYFILETEHNHLDTLSIIHMVLLFVGCNLPVVMPSYDEFFFTYQPADVFNQIWRFVFCYFMKDFTSLECQDELKPIYFLFLKQRFRNITTATSKRTIAEANVIHIQIDLFIF